jgi:hypothetical protein
MPIDADTGLSRWSSSHDRTPGLRWGSRPVSSSTRIAMARRYASVESKPCASSHSAATGHRSSGRSPRVNSASLQPSAAPARAMSSTSSGERKGALPWARSRPGVVTNVQ